MTKFHLNITRSARIEEIRNAVVQHLVEQGTLDDSGLSMVVENVNIENRIFEYELELKRLEIEQE